jgi:DNA-binding transcriptional regulator YiaG
MKEIWKDISNYEGLYQVSSYGRIRSLDHIDRLGRLKKSCVLSLRGHSSGYKLVNLYRNSKRRSYRIHRLVAQTFIPNHNNLPEVNHKDGNKSNNFIDNLEWVTSKENSDHKDKILGKCAKGEHHILSKLNNKEVKRIRGLLKEGKLTQQQIAEIYNVSDVTISHIKTGKKYKSVI